MLGDKKTFWGQWYKLNAYIRNAFSDAVSSSNVLGTVGQT